MKKLNPNAVGLSIAILSVACMLLISILANFGIYMDGFEMMKAWHVWYDLTLIGVILGMLEAFIFSYVAGYLFG